MYTYFIKRNRYRQGRLRKQEKDLIIAAVLKATRTIYLDKVATLSLDQVQYKTKEDQYQRKTTAAKRLLYKCSRYRVNWLTRQVTTIESIQDKYTTIEYYKEARFLRYNALPSIEYCREIQGKRTATSEFSIGSIAATTTTAQDRKRKRVVNEGSADESATITTIELLELEQEDEKGPSELGANSIRTRRTRAIPVLAAKEKKLASTDTLALALRQGFDRLAIAKIHPIETLTKARRKILDFIPTYNCQRFCQEKFKDSNEAATFATSNFEYRLRFLAIIQDNYDTPNYFKEHIKRIDRLRAQYNEGKRRIAVVEARGTKSYIVLIKYNIIKV